MSEDRTQAPSKRRRQQARERGQVARSPELTAAAGLLAAVGLLGVCGDDLARSLVALVRAPLASVPDLAADPAAVARHLRGAAWSVAWPLAAIVGGTIAAAVGAHQVQVGGLWTPGLLAPDPSRLWAAGRGGLVARGGRGAMGLVRAVVVTAVAAWVLLSGRASCERLASADARGLAVGSASLLRDGLGALGLAALALGLADFALCWHQVEAQLRLTPEEAREELRVADGDPALRARRRRVAQSWRRDPSDSTAGASLLITAPGGLAVLLAGGPPPAPVRVLAVARGPSAASLRRDAERAGIAIAVSPGLARHFALGPGHALPPDLAAHLATLWPGR